MMDRWDRPHHVNPRPPKDGVVGGLDVEDIEFHDDVEMIGANWELNRARGNGLRSRQNCRGATVSGG